MKVPKKTSISLFVVLFVLNISTVQACIPDWKVSGNDTIRWEAYYCQNNTNFSLEYGWNVSVSIDGFPRVNGVKYINGTLNQNGTITESSVLNELELSNLGPTPGFFLGDVLDNEHLSIKLISDSISLYGLKEGFESIENSHPDYTFSETTPMEVFNLSGEGIDGNYIWEYSGIVNYSYGNLLSEMNEYYFHNDTGSGFVEVKLYNWKLAMYARCLCGVSPCDPLIPGFPLYLLFGALVIGIVVLIRKQKPNQ